MGKRRRKRGKNEEGNKFLFVFVRKHRGLASSAHGTSLINHELDEKKKKRRRFKPLKKMWISLFLYQNIK